MRLLFFKNKFIGSFLFMLLLFITSCGEDSVLDKTRKVTGIVVDQASGQPLENVWVQLIADDDNLLVRSHVVQETHTDASGKFEFTYERVEDIYRVELNKPGYVYKIFSKGKNGFPDTYAHFQLLEYFKKEENFQFPMYALGTLAVKLQNIAPATSSDAIVITCPNCESEKTSIVTAPRAFTFTGTSEQILNLGQVAGKTYIHLKYKVTQDGQTQSLKDSVYVQPFVHNDFTLKY